MAGLLSDRKTVGLGLLDHNESLKNFRGKFPMGGGLEGKTPFNLTPRQGGKTLIWEFKLDTAKAPGKSRRLR